MFLDRFARKPAPGSAGSPLVPVLVTVMVLAAIAIIARLLPSYPLGVLVDGLIFAVLAMGLNLLVGSVGLPSLGHAAFFGIGAYAAGIVSVHGSSNLWIGLGAGLVASAALGAVFGLLALRTTGVYFLMITLALAQVAWAVAFSWRSVTGGDDGLRGVARPDSMIPGVSFDDRYAFFLLVLAVLVLVLWIMRRIAHSPFGTALRGIETGAVRMEALGYNVWIYKYIAFVISAAVSGLAGVLFVWYKGFVSPEAVSIVISAEVMLMVILGGAGTLAGPIVGAVTIVVLSNVASAYTDRWPFMLGLLYVVVILAAPDGVIRRARELIARAKPTPVASEPSAADKTSVASEP